MQKIGSLAAWELLDKGEYIHVPVTSARRSTIVTNSQDYVSLHFYPLLPSGKPDKKNPATFLARVIGLEEVRFRSPKPIAVVADAPCSIKTRVGQELHTYEASESFTRIIERKAVNPEVAAVVQRANANQRALIRALGDMKQDFDVLRQNQEQANAKPIDKPTGNSSNDEPAPKPKPPVVKGASAETKGDNGEGEPPKDNDE